MDQSGQQITAQLTSIKASLENTSIAALFNDNPSRAALFSCKAAGLLLDYSKTRLDEKALQLLLSLAKNRSLDKWIKKLFDGEQINNTEQREALHTLLRSPGVDKHSALYDKHRQIISTLQRMSGLVSTIHAGKWKGFKNKPITHIVNIGIGGSDLGPAMACQALTPHHHPDIEVFFVSNIDPSHLQLTLQKTDPASTLFIISSKSFTTQETLTNANAARNWLSSAGCAEQDLSKHFIAITANHDKANDFGIASDNIYPIWDWVGGRFSLWSAIGLPIALATSMSCFNELLAGAHEMDKHFRDSPFDENMPLILALVCYWHTRFCGYPCQVILPYDQSLSLLPDYLQQLEMESNGKSAKRDGSAVSYPTSPIIWGSAGSNGQHAFHQLLHQGTQVVPADFIAPLHGYYDETQHRLLLANCFAQSRALMIGKNAATVARELSEQGLSADSSEKLAPHKVMPGNRPSNTILIDKLTPRSLGALIAAYEHKVFALSVLWDINPFDQWGVELGKQLCNEIASSLSDNMPCSQFDESTRQLVGYYQRGKTTG